MDSRCSVWPAVYFGQSPVRNQPNPALQRTGQKAAGR
jgi:hypothetical protein